MVWIIVKWKKKKNRIYLEDKIVWLWDNSTSFLIFMIYISLGIDINLLEHKVNFKLSTIKQYIILKHSWTAWSTFVVVQKKLPCTYMHTVAAFIPTYTWIYLCYIECIFRVWCYIRKHHWTFKKYSWYKTDVSFQV